MIHRRKLLKVLAAPFIIRAAADWSIGFGGGYDCFLAIGDSNTYSGLNVDGTIPSQPTPNALAVEYKNAAIATSRDLYAIAKEPLDLNNDSNGLPVGAPSCTTTPAGPCAIGPFTTFLNYYVSNFLGSGRKVCIVVEGIGGTGIYNDGTSSTWNANNAGGGLPIAVTRINALLSANALNVFKGILTAFGANDAIAGVSQANFTSAFATASPSLASYLRANIASGAYPNAPIICTGLAQAWVATNPATFGPTQAALAAMPSNLANCGYVDTSNESIFTGQTAVPYHFTASAQVAIGNGFGAAYGALL